MLSMLDDHRQDPIFEIEQIDPSVAFIVTIHDEPVVTEFDQTLVFYRRKDAEEWIDAVTKNENQTQGD